MTISKFLKIYIYLLIAMNVSITKIFSSVSLLSYSPYIRFFTGLSAVLLMLICFMNQNIMKTIKPYLKSLNFIAIFVIIMYVVETVYTINKYRSTFTETMYVLDRYWCLFLVYPLMYLLLTNRKENKLQAFTKEIVVFTIISILIRFVIAIYYNFFGISILENIGTEYAIQDYARYGRMRVNTCCFGLMLIAYLLYLFYAEPVRRKKHTWVLLIIFSVFFTIYVNMSRANLLAQIAAIIIVFTFMKNAGNKKIFIWLASILAAVALLNTSFVQEFINSFNPSNVITGGSTSARLLSHEYYWGLFKENPVLGMGALFQGNKYQAYILNGMHRGHISYLEDLGAFASIYSFGIFAVVLYGIYYSHLIKGILVCKRDNSQNAGNHLVLLLGMMGVSIVAFFSTDFFLEMTIFSMPFNYVIIIFIRKLPYLTKQT